MSVLFQKNIVLKLQNPVNQLYKMGGVMALI